MNCADAALCRLETQKPYLIRASDLLAESSFATDIICNWNGTRYSAFTSDNGLSTPQNHASLLRRAANNYAQYLYVGSGGAKGGGAAGARAPAVKPCAPAVPRQLSTVTLTINESVGSEQQIILKTSTMMLSITLSSFLVSMADIR